MRRGTVTLIVLPSPGAPARQLKIPSQWRLIVATACLVSLTASLLVGRKARAWFRPEAVRTLLLESETMGPPEEQLGHIRFATAPREPSAHAASLPTAQAATSARADWAPAALGALNGLTGHPLALYDVNTHNFISVSPFVEHGEISSPALDALNRFMRCRRTGEMIAMDLRLIALLARISKHFSSAALHVVSAHRAVDGITTRRTSQHARGTAADIRIPGVSIHTLSKAAHALGATGIGLYTENKFVHVDVRSQPYSWSDAVRRSGSEADEESARDAELDAEATAEPPNETAASVRGRASGPKRAAP